MPTASVKFRFLSTAFPWVAATTPAQVVACLPSEVAYVASCVVTDTLGSAGCVVTDPVMSSTGFGI